MPYAVYDATGTVVRRLRTQAAADTYAATDAGLTAYQGDIADAALDVGVRIDTGTGAVLADATTAAQRLTAAWKARLHAAFQVYVDPAHAQSRQQWWVDVAGDAAVSAAAVRATSRWAAQQVALGDLIADRTWGSSSADDGDRETAIAHLCDGVSTLGRTWYGVMLAATGDDNIRVQWAGVGIGAGTALYSDLLSGSSLAVRAADGAFRPMAAARIAAGFRPDTPSLR